MIEILPLANWPGYSISDDGKVFGRNGRELALQPRSNEPGNDHLSIKLIGPDGKRHKRYVHNLVLETFVGPRPKGMHGRHLDGKTQHNHVSNLAWGTPSQNELDKVRHGTHPLKKRALCKFGHEFTPGNTRIKLVPKTSGHISEIRVCLTCYATGSKVKAEMVETMKDYGLSSITDAKQRRKLALLIQFDKEIAQLESA